ncbi:MAG: hypothetical protein JXR63_07140 [Spirochaetales bacterium]|nr:hypothetical protein [Spirochaetales bacterium]
MSASRLKYKIQRLRLLNYLVCNSQRKVAAHISLTLTAEGFFIFKFSDSPQSARLFPIYCSIFLTIFDFLIILKL